MAKITQANLLEELSKKLPEPPHNSSDKLGNFRNFYTWIRARNTYQNAPFPCQKFELEQFKSSLIVIDEMLFNTDENVSAPDELTGPMAEITLHNTPIKVYASNLLSEINTYVLRHGLSEITTDPAQQTKIFDLLNALNTSQHPFARTLPQRVARGVGLTVLLGLFFPLTMLYYAAKGALKSLDNLTVGSNDRLYGARANAFLSSKVGENASIDEHLGNGLLNTLASLIANVPGLLIDTLLSVFFEPLRNIFGYDDWAIQNKRVFDGIESVIFHILYLPFSLTVALLATLPARYDQFKKDWKESTTVWAKTKTVLSLAMLPADLVSGMINQVIRGLGINAPQVEKAIKFSSNLVWGAFLGVFVAPFVFAGTLGVIGHLGSAWIHTMDSSVAVTSVGEIYRTLGGTWIESAWAADGILASAAYGFGNAVVAASSGISSAFTAMGTGIVELFYAVGKLGTGIGTFFANLSVDTPALIQAGKIIGYGLLPVMAVVSVPLALAMKGDGNIGQGYKNIGAAISSGYSSFKSGVKGLFGLGTGAVVDNSAQRAAAITSLYTVDDDQTEETKKKTETPEHIDEVVTDTNKNQQTGNTTNSETQNSATRNSVNTQYQGGSNVEKTREHIVKPGITGNLKQKQH